MQKGSCDQLLQKAYFILCCLSVVTVTREKNKQYSRRLREIKQDVSACFVSVN